MSVTHLGFIIWISARRDKLCNYNKLIYIQKVLYLVFDYSCRSCAVTCDAESLVHSHRYILARYGTRGTTRPSN